MRFEFTNNAPVSALALTGACTASPVRRISVASPAAAIVLAARQLPTRTGEVFDTRDVADWWDLQRRVSAA